MPKILITASLFVCVALVGAGCGGGTPVAAPEYKDKATNGAQVEVLFTDADGYTMRRFYDKGYWRYYVTGPSKTMTVIGTQPNGKSTRPEEIPTVNR